jgi:RNA polymerase sigma-70 factor (ECF subfamily)
LAQEAMAVVLRQWSRVSSMDNPTGYLRRTAAHLAASSVRRRVVEAKALLRLSSQRSVLPDMDQPDKQFWAAVRRLPTRQAQAVALRYVYDCSVIEVAQVMNISEGAAKAHLFRGRRALSRILDLPAAPSDGGEVAS